MSVLDFFRSAPAIERREPVIFAEAYQNINESAALAAAIAGGTGTKSGQVVNVNTALTNTAVFRCVSLVANTIGMLPLHLIDTSTNEKAKNHPLYRLLHRRPNNWQSAFDFRSLMQLWALTEGNGYARIVRSRGKIIALVPIHPVQIKPIQNDDWTVSYLYTPKNGSQITFKPDEIFHLRGLSRDGLEGISLVEQAREAVGLALAADAGLSKFYRNGTFSDITLNVPKETNLSHEAIDRLRDSWNTRYSGSENAGRTPLLEGGIEVKAIGANARDAQSNETRQRQVEEIARVFGVPRPLLMVDETSWGSGVDVLGQFFVRYGLNPWFEAWQQAISRSLLTDDDQDRYEAKFNPGGLLRGSIAQQGEYFARALGAGGQQPWMWADEVRDAMDLPKREAPPNTMVGHNGGPPLNDNEAGNAA